MRVLGTRWDYDIFFPSPGAWSNLIDYQLPRHTRHGYRAWFSCHGPWKYGSGYRNRKMTENKRISETLIWEMSMLRIPAALVSELRRNLIFQAQIFLLSAELLSSLSLVSFLLSQLVLYFSLNCGSRNVGNNCGSRNGASSKSGDGIQQVRERKYWGRRADNSRCWNDGLTGQYRSSSTHACQGTTKPYGRPRGLSNDYMGLGHTL